MHKETQCFHSGGLQAAAIGGINSPPYTSTGIENADDLHADLAQVPASVETPGCP